MDIHKLSQNDIQEFIHSNKNSDIAALSLKKWPNPEWPKHEILQQIKSLQKATSKLPQWTTRKGIIFPKPEVIEQASSHATANYKATITHKGNLFLDLTAGSGSDFFTLSTNFKEGYGIDIDIENISLLKHNAPLLTSTPLTILHGTAEEIIPDLGNNFDVIYLDPQRRTEGGKKGLFRLEETSPNIIELLPILKQKAKMILIKTSPYMDITEGLRQLPGTSEVHIVEHDKQCKEVLFVINQKTSNQEPVQIISANLDKNTIYQAPYPSHNVTDVPLSAPLTYIYEPGPALMKSELHTNYAIENNLNKLAPLTHLYTSDTYLPDYPGRCLKYLESLSANKKAIHAALSDKKANISARNFPERPDQLRKKWGIKDGGHFTLFACTLGEKEHVILLCTSTK